MDFNSILINMFFIESLNSYQIKIFSAIGIVVLYHLLYIILISCFARVKEVNGTYTYSTKSSIVKIYKIYLLIRILSWNLIGVFAVKYTILKLLDTLYRSNKIDGFIILGWIVFLMGLSVCFILWYYVNQEYFSKDLKFIMKKNNNKLILSENFVKINAQEEISLEKYCLYFKNNRELNSFKTHLEELGLHLYRFHLSKVLFKKMNNAMFNTESLVWHCIKVIIKGLFIALLFSPEVASML